MTDLLNGSRRSKFLGGPGEYTSPWKFLDISSLNFPFLGFWVFQIGFWPIPFSSGEALQIGGLFHLLISTWKVLFIVIIMKNLTNFRKTVETGYWFSWH